MEEFDDYQGKRPDQVEKSTKGCLYALVAAIIILIFATIF